MGVGNRHSSVDPSAHTILRPGFDPQTQHLRFFNLNLNCDKIRPNINQKEVEDGPTFENQTYFVFVEKFAGTTIRRINAWSLTVDHNQALFGLKNYHF